jgi:hypothetical protein
MGLSDAVNEWKDLISNIPRQYYAVFIKKYNFFVLNFGSVSAGVATLLLCDCSW